MSTNLEKVLKKIKSNKTKSVKPENIRYGEEILGVQGTMRPVTIEGEGTVGLAVFVQNEMPEDPNGLLLLTPNYSYTDMYLENERYTTEHKTIYSNDTTDYQDGSNLIRGRTCPANFQNASYCQRGNVVHFFGYWSSTDTNNVDSRIKQHYKYDFDNNTWTKLSDCPTPQGKGGCIWIDEDTIYLIGTIHSNYYNYMYKYTISTDTWERLNDITFPNTTYTYNTNACIQAVYSTDYIDRIYVAWQSYLYYYSISSATFTFINNIKYYYGSYSSYNNVASTANYYITYYSGKILMSSTTGYNSNRNVYYNINNNSYSTLPTYRSSYGTIQKYICTKSSRIYGFSVNGPTYDTASQYNTYFNFNTGNETIINSSGNSYSSYKPINTYPLCYFQTELGDIIMNFCGTTTTETSTENPTMALVLNDKEYNFENNTLVIYSPDGTEGNYKTELYRNEKVLNGKIKQKFDDVNLYDATNQTMVKTIPTYYGNGTEWVKIKN